MALQARGLATVLAGANLIRPDCDYVGPDNYQALRLGYAHLREQGHRSIVAVVGDMGHVDWRQKRDMYVACAVQDGLTPAVVTAAETSDDELWQQLRRNLPGATAILATSDFLAIRVLGLLHRQGLRCPEQISVVGIDNVPSSEYAIPPLTTVDTSLRAIGRLAARCVIDRINHPDLAYATITPRPRLVVRSSTLPPKE
jgi:LacI family transcriptional regulator